MGRQLYLECCSGISGDMLTAALLDLGVEPEYLGNELEKLHLSGYRIEISKTKKNQITAMDFDVILEEDEHSHMHEHSHEHNHEHTHDHGHNHGHEHTHEHAHNSYEEIKELIKASDLCEEVKEIIYEIFEVIADAESKVHGVSKDNVHFHEVGAVDSIVDIASIAICLHKLGFREAVFTELWEGKGTTWCQHGRIPVPAPAVLEILAQHRIPVKFNPVEGEMITPTGAGAAAVLYNKKNKLPQRFFIEKIGVGAGKKDFPHANILRAMIINTEDEPEEKEEKKDKVWVLETNVDDCTGEQMGYAIQKLMESGALDASCIPVFMKKDRPAYLLSVICKEEKKDTLKDIIFRDTTSIGLREYEEERTILAREFQEVTVLDETCKMKVCSHHQEKYYYPEYADVQKICKKTGHAYREVYDLAVMCAKGMVGECHE